MTISRADLLPGQIVEVRQRYLVTDRRNSVTGEHKLRHLPPDELVIVRGRWRVSRTRFWGVAPYWVAAEQTPPGMSTLDTDLAIFDTHAEAIAYADRQARRPL